ncbi:MAG: hypothetical protein R3A11_03100 [Bdellovibrionota bacterium]
MEFTKYVSSLFSAGLMWVWYLFSIAGFLYFSPWVMIGLLLMHVLVYIRYHAHHPVKALSILGVSWVASFVAFALFYMISHLNLSSIFRESIDSSLVFKLARYGILSSFRMTGVVVALMIFSPKWESLSASWMEDPQPGPFRTYVFLCGYMITHAKKKYDCARTMMIERRIAQSKIRIALAALRVSFFQSVQSVFFIAETFHARKLPSNVHDFDMHSWSEMAQVAYVCLFVSIACAGLIEPSLIVWVFLLLIAMTIFWMQQCTRFSTSVFVKNSWQTITRKKNSSIVIGIIFFSWMFYAWSHQPLKNVLEVVLLFLLSFLTWVFGRHESNTYSRP